MKINKGQSFGHITPVKDYVKVLLILFALTALTVFTAKSDAINAALNAVPAIGGFLPIFLAMIIAGVKATFVLRNFMHMKHEKTIMWVYGMYLPLGVFGLLILFILLDGFTRILN